MRPSLRLMLLFVSICSGLWAAEPHLVVVYGANRKELVAADLATLPVVETEAVEHGKPHRFRGIAVRDVLALVEAPVWEKGRRSVLTFVVKARAADGYVVIFALAEFDAAFREQTILLADTEDGSPLPESTGPLRFVCPGDKRGARSIRQVTSLEVIALAGEPAPKS
jgi:DMSO/TMAO reductase YedYZ molybdopterin-dependent catalytic subunit